MPNDLKFLMTDGQVIFWRDGKTGKNYALRTELDSDTMDPLQEDPENPVKLACWSRRHELGTPGLVGKLDMNEFWHRLLRENMSADEIMEKLRSGALHRFTAQPNRDDPALFDVRMEDDREIHDYKGVTAAEALDCIEDDLTSVECQTILYDTLAALPLWIYEHSGITISCGDRTYPYNDQFDSGHLGWGYCTRKALEDIGLDIDDKTWRDEAVKQIRGTVKTYDQYLTGDVWWYSLLESDVPFETATEQDDWDEVDSCGNYYGSDLFESGIAENMAGNGLIDAIREETYRTGRAQTTYIPQTTFVLD